MRRIKRPLTARQLGTQGWREAQWRPILQEAEQDFLAWTPWIITAAIVAVAGICYLTGGK